MTTVVRSKGGAALSLFTGLAQAVATGLSASKEVDEGCNEGCPDDTPKRGVNPRIKYTRRRRRRR
jgi:hypothetical protein